MYNKSFVAAARELKIHDVSVLVTGSTGLIGSCAIDVMYTANKEQGEIYTSMRQEEVTRKLEKGLGIMSSHLFRI